MPERLARALLLVLLLLPAAWRSSCPQRADLPVTCEPEGRGRPPGHWIGCAGDPGPVRRLTGPELVLLGRPVDLNDGTAEDLAAVPGLSPSLAAAIAADRAENGPFPSVDALRRVRGIGPARLARARPFLQANRAGESAAQGGEAAAR